MTDYVLEVRLDEVVASPYQPRRLFEESELEGLARSIQEIGLIHPPVVRPLGFGKGFELISGERRLRAAKRAGLKTIPVLVRPLADAASAEACLVENVQREDLNPIEVAQGLKQLAERFAYDQETLAKRVGKKRSTVANYLRLLQLDPEIQDALALGRITMGHAKVILSLEDRAGQKTLFQKINQQGLTVRQATKWVNDVKQGPKSPSTSVERLHLDALVKRLEERFHCRVTCESRGRGGGSITFSYLDLEDLDRLLHLLGSRE